MSPAKKALGLGVATLALALPALGCAWTVWQLGIDSLRSRFWTPTPATVSQAGTHKHVTDGIQRRTGTPPDIVTYEPWAVYEYTVNERKYSSSRVGPSRVYVSEGGGAGPELGARLVKAKETRQPITVYVNAADPTEVVADRSLPTTPFIVFSLIALGASAFYALVLYRIFTERKQP